MWKEMETGGGSGAIDTTHGEETLTASAVIDIDTGLSEVSRFEMFTNSNNSSAVFYDKTVDSSKYKGMFAQGGTGTVGQSRQYNLGSGDGSRVPTINSITGGTVRITAPSGSADFLGKAYWYASK